MSNAATIAEPVDQRDIRSKFRSGPINLPVGHAVVLFRAGMLVALLAYGRAGWLVSWMLPRSLIERAPLAWLVVSTGLMAAATQTIPNFFPDYTNPREILFEVLLWLSIGLFARVYLVYTDHPDTFEGLKHSIASRPLERWISAMLNHPIDAIFTRIWVGNSLAILPLTILLIAAPHQ